MINKLEKQGDNWLTTWIAIVMLCAAASFVSGIAVGAILTALFY